VKFLVDNGSGLSLAADKMDCNILHFLAKQCMQQRLSDLLMTIHVCRSHYVNLCMHLFTKNMVVDRPREFSAK